MHRQAIALPKACPHGQGLAASTSWNWHGKLNGPWARVTVTRPVSIGWRSACNAAEENSGASSRNSTPWWAWVTAPGSTTAEPPPINPTGEAP